jgi:hypothetical protein
VADEPTPGELYRRFQDHEQRTDRIHSELDNRITRMAAESVPLDVYQADQRARDREDTARDRRVEALEKRPALTAGRWAVIATAIVAVLALAVQAYGTLKGAHS